MPDRKNTTIIKSEPAPTALLLADAPLKLLLVEDREDDAWLIERELKRNGLKFTTERVANQAQLSAALDTKDWDLLITDYNLPGFTAWEVLKLYQKLKLDIPFVVVSGQIGEEIAVDLMRAGAHDFVSKNNLARLSPAIKRELDDANIRQERAKAKIELEKTKERYHSLWDNAPVAYHTLDRNGIITDVNKTEIMLLGYTKEEMIGRPIFDFIVPDQRQEARRRFSRKLAGQKIPLVKNRQYQKKDGTIILVHSEDYVERGDHGQVTDVRTAMIDVTKQVAAESALHASQERYRALVENASDFIFMIDKDHKVQSVNHAAAKVLGKDPQEIIGSPLSELFPGPIAGEYGRSIAGIFKTGRSTTSDTRMIANGRQYWINAVLSPIRDAKGDIIAVMGATRDITENKKAQDEIRKSSEVREAINRILRISQLDLPLRNILNRVFDALLSIPWIALKARGGIWLALEPDSPLTLTVHRDLPQDLIIKCGQLKAGVCICGQAAQSGKLIYSADIDDGRHTVKYPQIVPHGHYCVPILSRGKTLGIINLYLEDGHKPDQREMDFLRAVSDIIANIVESHQAKRALQKSEEKYRTLINDAADGVAIIDLNGRIDFVNSALEAMFGFSRKEMIGAPLDKFVHPDDIMAVTDRFQRRSSGKRLKATHELKAVTRDGKIRHISYSGTTIIYEGKIIGVQWILRDITDNKILEERIRRSKRHYEQVIDTIRDGIVVIGRDYRVKSCNRIFAQKVELPIETIKDRPCREILPLYENKTLNGGDNGAAFVDKVCGPNSVFVTGHTMDFTEKYIDRNNRDHYHEISIYPGRNANGLIDQLVITISDVTEQHKAEEEIRRLSEFNQRILDASPVSIVVLDREGTIIAANTLANDLMGQNDKEVVGRKLTETKEIRNNSELLTLYHTLLEGGQSFFFDKLSYLSEASGQRKYLNIIAVPLIDKAKMIEGAISMAVDNTEAVKAKKTLQHLNENLETEVSKRIGELAEINKKLNQVLDLKSKFIADASHELRTPLTVIQGNLELAIMEMNSSGGEIPEVYQTILDEVSRMANILSDLTMLTNLDSKNEQFHYENVNLDNLVKAVGMSLKVLADQKKIALIYKKGLKHVEIKGDEAKLEKVVINIVRNGIKYTEANGRVRIWLEAEASEARVIVEDNGIGIPEADLPFIFERFYRVDKARSRAEGGSGLGLAIAKWIIDAHRGRIDVFSRVGKGTKFVIRLPLNHKTQKLCDSLF